MYSTSPESDPFEPAALALSEADRILIMPTARRRLRRRKPGQLFVPGPIPLDWIEAAAKLPGRALYVGLLLWRETRCRKRAVVKFSIRRAADAGFHSDTVRRGLFHLERAGLVRVERRPGCCPRVELLEVPG